MLSEWLIPQQAAPRIALSLNIYCVTCHKQIKVTEFWKPEFNNHIGEYVF